MKREFNESWITPYKESIDGLKKLVPNKEFVEAAWNKNSNLPVSMDTEIFLHPSQEFLPEKYVRVIYSEYRAIAVFSKVNFDLEKSESI
jgi:hypothetical protein